MEVKLLQVYVKVDNTPFSGGILDLCSKKIINLFDH